jgi:hypothetical protein
MRQTHARLLAAALTAFAIALALGFAVLVNSGPGADADAMSVGGPVQSGRA